MESYKKLYAKHLGDQARKILIKVKNLLENLLANAYLQKVNPFLFIGSDRQMT